MDCPTCKRPLDPGEVHGFDCRGGVMDCPTCKRPLDPGEVHWSDCRAEARAERYRKALEEIEQHDSVCNDSCTRTLIIARRALKEK